MLKFWWVQGRRGVLVGLEEEPNVGEGSCITSEECLKNEVLWFCLGFVF